MVLFQHHPQRERPLTVGHATHMQANFVSTLPCQLCCTLERHGLLAGFQMECLQRICGIFLLDHVPNVDILNRCNTLSMEPQLQSNRFRSYLHHA